LIAQRQTEADALLHLSLAVRHKTQNATPANANAFNNFFIVLISQCLPSEAMRRASPTPNVAAFRRLVRVLLDNPAAHLPAVQPRLQGGMGGFLRGELERAGLKAARLASGEARRIASTASTANEHYEKVY